MPSGLTRDEYFLRKVDKTDTCWLWTGGLTADGHGKFSFVQAGKKHARTVLAHRYGYQLWVGPIPAGLVLDHVWPRCTNKNCVRPDHLEPVTVEENHRRYYESVTRCVNGHEFTAANTRMYRGWRQCRTCGKERSARSRGRSKQSTRLSL